MKYLQIIKNKLIFIKDKACNILQMAKSIKLPYGNILSRIKFPKLTKIDFAEGLRHITQALGIPLVLTLVEIIAHALIFHKGCTAITILTIFGFGLLISFIVYLFSFIDKWLSAGLGILITAVLTVYVIACFVYFKCLHMFYTWEMFFMASQVGQFKDNINEGISQNLGSIILMLLPFIIYTVLTIIWTIKTNPKHREFSDIRDILPLDKMIALCVGLAFLLASYYVMENNQKAKETANGMLYDSNAAYDMFGFQMGTYFNLRGMTFGYGSPDAKFRGNGRLPGFSYNEINIDWDKLISNESNPTIKDMHEYFASLTPTEKNQYTGMFKGKNLIFLTLEGFSIKCIDPEMTPTLYKMFNEGFKFTNFYDTTWAGSTASGEYSNMTGSFYTSGFCLKDSATTYTYSALGNMFKSAGYTNYAFHNNHYQYYDRDLSHPNFGYQWQAVAHNLPRMENVWPRSDAELARVTEAQYMDTEGPWQAYYMTISGHAGYEFDKNEMSKRHEKDLPAKYDSYDSGVRAYLACNIEVDLMLAELIKALEARGQLENTVFAMCCDHYPYALTPGQLAQLYGLSEDRVLENPDLYRNAFILWSSAMKEPVVVDKVCNSYDIAPTLYNLFGIKYESRIIIGKDILSKQDNPSIINFNEGVYWNWITEKGFFYNNGDGQFTPNEGARFSDGQENYVAKTNERVKAMRKYSMAILDNDYYRYLKDYLN